MTGMITQAELKRIFDYDEETGIFTWREKQNNRALAESRAGTLSARGYIIIIYKKKPYLAHRLAWLYVHGSLPAKLDHKNRVKADNRIKNLRPATSSQNAVNKALNPRNTSGYRGVSLCKQTNKWRASCALHGKSYRLGRFNTKEEAARVRDEFAKELHREFYQPSLIESPLSEHDLD